MYMTGKRCSFLFSYSFSVQLIHEHMGKVSLREYHGIIDLVKNDNRNYEKIRARMCLIYVHDVGWYTTCLPTIKQDYDV